MKAQTETPNTAGIFPGWASLGSPVGNYHDDDNDNDDDDENDDDYENDDDDGDDDENDNENRVIVQDQPV